ncbi:MAG: protein kinase domain-containing protein [Burkholderiales bacterium]
MPDAIGPYSIVREIGRGGMGVVYEGWDERLSRAVAIKTILRTSDTQMRERLVREARVAASVSHPHICQLFDIGEHAGEPFLCMELLDGQSLADRLREGALTVSEATSVALAILSALSALHRRGIVHRDLKPTNVFLTPNGVKLLDFGLARPSGGFGIDETGMTMPGVVMGSPRYMAPEQVRGDDIDARTDIFAAGLVLYEMLTGRAAFGGTSAIDILHAVVHDQPPALMGSPAVLDVDRIIQRAVAKVPSDRYQSADEMATDLRASLSRTEATDTAQARMARRLVVLPFRVLRPAPEVDFLAYSLPDAITVSLSVLDSLTMRSTLAAARFGDGAPDLRALASELAVDAAIIGTLLHTGQAVRVAVQLIDVPSGTLRWSHSAQVPLDDLFSIQDSICSAVVDALALPMTAREQQVLKQDVPANNDAYELFLRANRLSTNVAHWAMACDLYKRAVQSDPSYAPAWARLGRILRNMGKYGRTADATGHMSQAHVAFQRAFRENPDLPLIHNLYTYMEVESGHALDAMLRLLERLRTRTNDPDLFAGLVHACRYVGLLEASVAAYRRATRLDPGIATSAAHAFYMLGQYDRAIHADADQVQYVSVMSYLALGQQAEAIELVRAGKAEAGSHPQFQAIIDLLDALLTGHVDEGRRNILKLMDYPAFDDPEGFYYWAQGATVVGDHAFALSLLQRSVDSGFHCPRALESSPLLDELRGTAEFADLLARAREGHEAAASAFARADGYRLLGLPPRV